MPLKGVRLEYDVVMPVDRIFAGSNTPDTMTVRVRMKESIGEFFNLRPVFPEYGNFKSHVDPNNPNANPDLNEGYRYTKRSGFRYQSYKFFLVDGTQVQFPVRNGQGGTDQKIVKAISVGFPKSGVTDNGARYNVTTASIIDWTKGLGADQIAKIKGIETPRGTRHFWKGDIPNQVASSSP